MPLHLAAGLDGRPLGQMPKDQSLLVVHGARTGGKPKGRSLLVVDGAAPAASQNTRLYLWYIVIAVTRGVQNVRLYLW